MNYSNFDKLPSYEKLRQCQKFDIKNIDKDRIQKYCVKESGSLMFNYAALPVDEKTIDTLQCICDEACVIEKYRALLGGEVMNTGENRKVLHQLCRNLDAKSVYSDELKRIEKFSDSVRCGSVKGSTGKAFKSVVQIGIGGSDLGPRALCYALANLDVEKMEARFISNVDPDDACLALNGLDLESTLFILVSKSGTTQETLTNRDLAFSVMRKAGIKEPEKHMVYVTSSSSPLAKTPGALEVFLMDDFVGGRYSSTSAVGGVVLSLVYGFDVFKEILLGAHDEDNAALEGNIRKNGVLLDAAIGVYMRNVLDYKTSAVLPYSQALNRFPAHLQQLDMESNGKSVNRIGEKISYKTGPVIFGEPGTNGQHSFYQLLHQGTDIVPMQFIGFKQKQGNLDAETDGSTSQKKLKANLAAQIVAFARGQKSENLNKNFEGGRPSSLLVMDKLTPYALGALLSHFENKVMFQGFIWNLNSFDQEGVQLGKVLAKKVLSGCENDEVLSSYAEVLGINEQ